MGDEYGKAHLSTPSKGKCTVKKWLLLLGLTVVGGGAIYYWWHGGSAHALQEKALTFAEVRRTTIRDIVSATGLVEPRETVVVSSEIPGTVMHLVGRVGDIVKENAPLAILDGRRIKLKLAEAENGVHLAKAAVAQANAALIQANANELAARRYWETQDELQRAGAPGFRTEREQAKAQHEAALAGIKVAKAGVDAAEAKKSAADTAFKEAELTFNMTTIRVPGIYPMLRGNQVEREFLILERKAHEGQMVGPQSGPLFSLAHSLDVVEVHAQVAEGDINKIKPRLKALFKVTNFDDQDSDFDDGLVKEIRPLASTIKGAVYYDAVIEVKNRKDSKTGEWQLRPGMTVSIDIVRNEHANVWRVPIGALNFKLEEAYQDAATKARMAEWDAKLKADWRALWVWDKQAQKARAVFVRVLGKPGENPLKDAEGNEILEWEPGQEPTGPLPVIIGAPPARPPSIFDQPANVKI
jgi:multidrug efflux pump subunit AcrA (membrane-fusion protein)